MPRRGDHQHSFPSVPEQPARAGRIGIRLVRAADQAGTLRNIAFDPNEFRCARLAGELADEWVDYAETSGISRISVSLGRRAIRSFCTTADLLLGKDAHRASLARQHPDIAAVVAALDRIDRALGWAPGSAAAVMDGGTPTSQIPAPTDDGGCPAHDHVVAVLESVRAQLHTAEQLVDGLLGAGHAR
jgi:hypothetical protein